MRFFTQRVMLPAVLLTWALAHADLCAGDAKGTKAGKGAKEPMSIEQIRKTLDRPITLDFSGQSVVEALQHLREKTNLEFNLDQVAIAITGVNVDNAGDQPIMMKSAGGKLSAVLRKLLNGNQLTYVIFEDSILITTPELATLRQMKQRINVDVDEVPLTKAIRDLARNYAFNLVVDPRVAKESQKPVSLSLDGASLETSVRLLAEMAGLKAVRMDNVMYITNEERADKLRKEDKDALPNPLDDPNMLGNPRAPALGGLNNLGIAGPAFRAIPLPPPAGEATEKKDDAPPEKK